MKKVLQILLLTLIITTCTLNQGVNNGDKGETNTNDNFILTILENDERAGDNEVIGINIEIINFSDETVLTEYLDLSNGENVLRAKIEEAQYKLKIIHEFENETSFNDWNYHIGIKENIISQATITAGEMGSISINSTDTWELCNTMPHPFGAFGYAVVNDQIYIIGGSNKDVTADVYVQRYTPATDTWEQLAPLPAPRALLYCGVINGKIHAIGGWDENQSYRNDHYIYDPNDGIWTTGLSIPNYYYPIGQFAATVNNKIYVFGGWWGNYKTTVLEYSDTEPKWTTLGTEMPTARNHGTTAVYNGEIYVIAGETRAEDENGELQNCQPIDIVEKYNPIDNEWTEDLEPMPAQLHWLGSSGCPVSSDGLIYVLGPGNTAYTYSPTTNSWETIEPMFKSAYGVANIGNSIYAIGPEATYKYTLPNSDPNVSITDKNKYFEVIIDINNGTHQQVGELYGAKILEAVPNFEELVDSYINDCILDSAGGSDFIAGIIYSNLLLRVSDIKLQLQEEYKDEIEGLASNFLGGTSNIRGDDKISTDEVYMLNLFPDIARMTQCSAVSVFGSLSDTSKTITGRILDWPSGDDNQLSQIHAVVTINNNSTSKRSICSIGYLGFMGILTGFNENNIFAGILDSPTGGAYSSANKKSYAFDLRYALENENYSNIDDISNYMMDTSNSYTCGHLIFLSDSNESKVIENDISNQLNRRERTYDSLLNTGIAWNIDNAIGAVNSFVLNGNVDNHTVNTNNTARWDSIITELSSKGTTVSVNELKDVISYDMGDGIDGPGNQSDGDLYNIGTQQIVIFQPDTFSLEVYFRPKNGIDPNDPEFELIMVNF